MTERAVITPTCSHCDKPTRVAPCQNCGADDPIGTYEEATAARLRRIGVHPSPITGVPPRGYFRRAAGPEEDPPKQIISFYGCKSGCGRSACTHSGPEHPEYCCYDCHDSSGASHHAGCNTGDEFNRRRMVTLSIGDGVQVGSVAGGDLYGEVVTILKSGSYEIRVFNDRRPIKFLIAKEIPTGGRLAMVMPL